MEEKRYSSPVFGAAAVRGIGGVMGSRRKGTYSLKKQLVWLVMIGYFSLLILLVIFDFYSISSYWNQKRQSTLEGFNRYVAEIDESMDMVDDLIRENCINNDEFEILAGGKDELASYQAAYSFSRRMKSKLLSETKLKGIVLGYDYGENCRYLFYDGFTYEERNSIKDTILGKMKEPGYDNGWFLLQLGNNFLAVNLYEKKGAAAAGIISLSQINFDIRQYTESDTEIVITDNQSQSAVPDYTDSGLKVWSQQSNIDSEFTGQWENEKGNYLVYQHPIANVDATVRMFVKNDFWRQLHAFQIILLLITFFSVIFVIYLQFLLRKQLIKPLYDLTATMNRICEGQWDSKITDDTRILEFKEVRNTLDTMINEIKRLKIQSYEEKLDKQKAQLQYLQLQLKPHFFLNCLKSMNALVLEQRYGKMQDLIFNISAHLRYLLQSECQTVKLGQELEYVKNYLELQNTISYRKVKYDMSVAPEALDYEIPTLAIQTFVENSFKYAKLPEGYPELKIAVKVIVLQTEEENFLDMTVSDNGEGYSAGMLELLNKTDYQDEPGMGIGILNLKKRCFLLYGSRAEYLFQNQDGAVSELIIPCNKELK